MELKIIVDNQAAQIDRLTSIKNLTDKGVQTNPPSGLGYIVDNITPNSSPEKEFPGGLPISPTTSSEPIITVESPRNICLSYPPSEYGAYKSTTSIITENPNTQGLAPSDSASQRVAREFPSLKVDTESVGTDLVRIGNLSSTPIDSTLGRDNPSNVEVLRVLPKFSLEGISKVTLPSSEVSSNPPINTTVEPFSETLI